MTRRLALVPISSLALAAALTLVPTGCARNPVTGKNELSLVSDRCAARGEPEVRVPAGLAAGD